MRLKDKVAIVTGGGIGIGRAYCLALAREGAKVVAADIQDGEARRVVEEIKKSGGDAIAVPVDVTSPEKTLAMADAALARYGRIDILVNNAALYSAIKKKPFIEIDEEEWDRVMAVNVKGLFLCMQAVYPAMKRQGKGKIVNISSTTTMFARPLRMNYVTAKSAVIGLTRALAAEVSPDGINVNCIAPGLTMSEGAVATYEADFFERLRGMQLIKRNIQPADLAGAVVFLASDDSDMITAQTLVVDGGLVMH
jgi:NAD(P)-dependent dehydrogenase (short-subunit alcohol dehydrogenase family)